MAGLDENLDFEDDDDGLEGCFLTMAKMVKTVQAQFGINIVVRPQLAST